jgi:hypothetical protein
MAPDGPPVPVTEPGNTQNWEWAQKQLTSVEATGTDHESRLDTLEAFNFAHGTYTATATAVANLAAVVSNTAQYARIGSFVVVTGSVGMDVTTASTVTQLRIALPVASNFAAAEQCGGVVVELSGSGGTSVVYAIQADTTNDAAFVTGTCSTDTTSNVNPFIFGYLIV